MNADLEIDGSGIRIAPDRKLWRFTRPVLQAQRHGNRVFVIFDYMSYPQGKPAPNLCAYDLDQNEIWTVESPTKMRTDAFVNFCPSESLQVANFAGYVCTIDRETGSVIDTTFTK